MLDLQIYTPTGGSADQGAIQQMKTCMAVPEAVAGCLSADHHLGYSMPVGGTIAYDGLLSPSGVGYDIGCGNKAVATNLLYSQISADMPRIMDEVTRRISFGMGVPAAEKSDHPILDAIARHEDPNLKAMARLAAEQLGTVGGGNHYVDIFREEGTDRVWIGVHFGSRGFGHKTASGFMSLAAGSAFTERVKGEGIHDKPILFREDEWLGYAYQRAMATAGLYAYAGRDVVCEKVLDILGAVSVREVHNHHNFAWKENGLWVVRKGATPLFPNQEGFVGGSMGEPAVIVQGKSTQYRSLILQAGDRALWSAPHGAGRAMSRTEAKGKTRKRTRCSTCDHTQGPGQASFSGGSCPKCGSTEVKPVWIQEQAGKVSWPDALADLKRKGIHLRGGDADEAPLAYKRLPAVLAAHEAYVEITATLIPVGVAMAPRGTRDDYKD